ncbi:hypothetical protein MMPV_002492 [Pyropia vietnamensis]
MTVAGGRLARLTAAAATDGAAATVAALAAAAAAAVASSAGEGALAAGARGAVAAAEAALGRRHVAGWWDAADEAGTMSLLDAVLPPPVGGAREASVLPAVVGGSSERRGAVLTPDRVLAEPSIVAAVLAGRGVAQPRPPRPTAKPTAQPAGPAGVSTPPAAHEQVVRALEAKLARLQAQQAAQQKHWRQRATAWAAAEAAWADRERSLVAAAAAATAKATVAPVPAPSAVPAAAMMPPPSMVPGGDECWEEAGEGAGRGVGRWWWWPRPGGVRLGGSARRVSSPSRSASPPGGLHGVDHAAVRSAATAAAAADAAAADADDDPDPLASVAAAVVSSRRVASGGGGKRLRRPLDVDDSDDAEGPWGGGRRGRQRFRGGSGWSRRANADADDDEEEEAEGGWANGASRVPARAGGGDGAPRGGGGSVGGRAADAASAAVFANRRPGSGRGGGGVPPSRGFRVPRPLGQAEADAEAAEAAVVGGADGAAGTAACAAGDLPEVTNVEPRLVEMIINEVLERSPGVEWQDIAGLTFAKACVMEAVVWPMRRADLFSGLRSPPKGVLLFGPPGTGKTMIGRAIASQTQATFFNISASSMMSKWVGEGEKTVRALFGVARALQPAVIFIDEVDSLLTQRTDGDAEASRRVKTEFLVQMDGAGTSSADRVLVVGATNRPQELDEAARRRLVKRLYIPLPDMAARRALVGRLLRRQRHSLDDSDLDRVAALTAGYSGSDVHALCAEAAMAPLRCLGDALLSIDAAAVRPVEVADFVAAARAVRASVGVGDLAGYEAWNRQYGSFA